VGCHLVAQDRSSNLLQFTPSQLFSKGQYELSLFNSLYSQTEVWNRSGEVQSFGIRQSILTNIFQLTVGVSESARWNVGLDFIPAAGSVGTSEGSGHFQLFGNGATSKDIGIASIGPRIKWQPFQRLAYFSIQSTFLLPVSVDLEAQEDREVFLALDRYTWRNQFFYDWKLTHQLRLFTEIGVNYLMVRNQDQSLFPTNFLDLPVTLFVNYFPTDKINIYLNAQYAPRYGQTAASNDEEMERKFGLLQWYNLAGGGIKYQVTHQLGLEIGYAKFIAGRGFEGLEAGAGHVTNFALRFIR
jgi:hypothetical protein